MFGAWNVYWILCSCNCSQAIEGIGLVVCLDSFEDEPLSEEICRDVFEMWNAKGKSEIQLRKVDSALNELERMKQSREESFDFVFIDADKENQIKYVDFISNHLLRKGGLIMVDNTLWYSRVLENPDKVDDVTRSIQEFSQYVSKDPRFDVLMIPVRDGLTVIRKKL